VNDADARINEPENIVLRQHFGVFFKASQAVASFPVRSLYNQFVPTLERELIPDGM
jgi:hypothetical protein